MSYRNALKRFLGLSLVVLVATFIAAKSDAQPIRFTVPLSSCAAPNGTLMPATLEIFSLACQRLEGGFGLVAYNQQNLYVASVGPGVYNIRVKVANWLTVWVRNVQMGWGGVTITFPQALNGDADGNDAVSLQDLSLTLLNFGTIGTPPISGDLDWDGSVTLQDLSTALLNFGKFGEGC